MDKAAKAAFSFFLYVLPPAGCGKKRGPGGGGRAKRAQRQGTGACGPGPLALVWGARGGRKRPHGPPKRRRPPGPRFFYGADDAILEESPGAVGDSVQGG